MIRLDWNYSSIWILYIYIDRLVLIGIQRTCHVTGLIQSAENIYQIPNGMKFIKSDW